MWLGARYWWASGLPPREIHTNVTKTDCMVKCQALSWCKAVTGSTTESDCRLLETTIMESTDPHHMEFINDQAFYTELYYSRKIYIILYI